MSNLIYAAIKLISGQEVFAKLLEEEINSNDPFIVMEDPLIQEEFFNEDGTTSVAMAKFSTATHERHIPLAKHTIISTAIMSEPFRAYYKESVDISNMSLEKYDEKLIQMASKMAAHNIIFRDDADGHSYQSIQKH